MLLRIFLNFVQQGKQKLGVKITCKRDWSKSASLLFTLDLWMRLCNSKSVLMLLSTVREWQNQREKQYNIDSRKHTSLMRAKKKNCVCLFFFYSQEYSKSSFIIYSNSSEFLYSNSQLSPWAMFAHVCVDFTYVRYIAFVAGTSNNRRFVFILYFEFYPSFLLHI